LSTYKKGDGDRQVVAEKVHVNEAMPLPFVLDEAPHLGGPLDLFPEEVCCLPLSSVLAQLTVINLENCSI